ncbi:hypothetical protein BOTNAR_0018g00020 [Botryotinia narcissicola]|uniref:Uncharacterized protein n=1 Tax=Botryotinia narcissicola TaxID=278944 RepID=A0A4Z1J5N0_9HELO|nr:hypothetical protein BOTNAR_0018g00020 [Botryotinia narcissicola]
MAIAWISKLTEYIKVIQSKGKTPGGLSSDDGVVISDRLLKFFKNGRHNLPNLAYLVATEIPNLTSPTTSSSMVDQKLTDASPRSGFPTFFH